MENSKKCQNERFAPNRLDYEPSEHKATTYALPIQMVPSPLTQNIGNHQNCQRRFRWEKEDAL